MALSLLSVILLAGCGVEGLFGDATIVEDEFKVINRTERLLHAEVVGIEPRANGRSPVDVWDSVEVVDNRWVISRSGSSGSALSVFLFDAQCYGEGMRVYDGLTGLLVATYDEPLCGLTEWEIEDEDLPADLRPEDETTPDS